MTPAAYLESRGYEVTETRGNLYEVFLDGATVVSDITETELAAFADEVRAGREQ